MSEREDPGTSEQPPRVLIGDDDAVLALGVSRALEAEGYTVRAVHQGDRIVAEVLAFKPDIVLLDVMMPGTDGWEVLAQLRAGQASRDVPVIMLTAADSEAAKVKGFTLGADDYVTKPFGVKELRCRIGAVLRRARPADANDVPCSLQVVTGGSGVQLIRCEDVCYVEGIRNYTYVHTANDRYLSRVTLGALEDRRLRGFMRVHRSYIVNLERVKGCGWASKSSYRLQLADTAQTPIPVSRALVSEVQRRLGLRT